MTPFLPRRRGAHADRVARGPPAGAEFRTLPGIGATSQLGTTWHSVIANLVFVDGHAEALTPEVIHRRYVEKALLIEKATESRHW